MTINILAFGIAKDILGENAIALPVSEGMTAGQLKEGLSDKFPQLKELKSFMIAVNGEYALPELMLGEDDEIAIIPPVSGG